MWVRAICVPGQYEQSQDILRISLFTLFFLLVVNVPVRKYWYLTTMNYYLCCILSMFPSMLSKNLDMTKLQQRPPFLHIVSIKKEKPSCDEISFNFLVSLHGKYINITIIFMQNHVNLLSQSFQYMSSNLHQCYE